MRLRVGAPRVLDFDCENRPLSYLGQDFTTSEITAIAWAWVGIPKVEACLLGESDMTYMLTRFLEMYNQAHIVTGHNIIRHDLPILNGALLEAGLPGLSPKLVSDTYRHLHRRSGISASQESLAGMLGIKAPKVGMGQVQWREANRLTPEGIEKTRARVVGDVKQHLQLRKRLLELGWLKPPMMWRP